jgi:hypothetical protein
MRVLNGQLRNEFENRFAYSGRALGTLTANVV